MNLTDALNLALPEVILAGATLVLIVIGAFGRGKADLLVSGLSVAALVGAALLACCTVPLAVAARIYRRRDL